jgi:hypothetical protein
MGKKAVTVSTSSGSDGKRDASEKKLFKLFSTLREVLTDPDVKVKAQDGLTAFVLGVIPSASERILEVSQNEEQKKALLESTKDFTGYQGESEKSVSSPALTGAGMGQEMPEQPMAQTAPQMPSPGMAQSAGTEQIDAMIKSLQGGQAPAPAEQSEMPNGEA